MVSKQLKEKFIRKCDVLMSMMTSDDEFIYDDGTPGKLDVDKSSIYFYKNRMILDEVKDIKKFLAIRMKIMNFVYDSIRQRKNEK